MTPQLPPGPGAGGPDEPDGQGEPGGPSQPAQPHEPRVPRHEPEEILETTPAAEAIEVVEEAIEEGEEGGGSLRRYVALGIVIASILAAAMAWRASVADEAASAKESLAEQNLLQQEELTAADEATVFHDVQLFDRYEEHVNLAQVLGRDSAHAPPAAGGALAIRAQQERQLAAEEHPLFEQVFPATAAGGRATFDAAYARSQVVLRDTDLMNLKAPATLRAEASADHEKGVRLTGLAVLFVGTLVLFTFAELSRAGLARLFSFSGAAVGLAAAVLYFLI